MDNDYGKPEERTEVATLPEEVKSRIEEFGFCLSRNGGDSVFYLSIEFMRKIVENADRDNSMLPADEAIKLLSMPFADIGPAIVDVKPKVVN